MSVNYLQAFFSKLLHELTESIKVKQQHEPQMVLDTHFLQIHSSCDGCVAVFLTLRIALCFRRINFSFCSARPSHEIIGLELRVLFISVLLDIVTCYWVMLTVTLQCSSTLRCCIGD